MRRRRLVLPLAWSLLAISCASSRSSPPPGQPAPASTPPPAPAPPETGAAPGGAPPAPTPTLPPAPSRGPIADYRDVLKLYRANLSEDFILERIKRDGAVYDLNADKVIELRNSGVSERVIQAMLDTKRDAAAAATAAVSPGEAPRRPPEDRISVDAGAPPLPPPSMSAPISAAPVVWEGLSRREPGVVILKNRWRVGRLTFADGQLRWEDARDSSKNLLVPWNVVKEQFMTCLKKAGGNECFEWGVRTTRGDEYRFRDVAWEQGENLKVFVLHDYFRGRFPSLVDSQLPVDEK